MNDFDQIPYFGPIPYLESEPLSYIEKDPEYQKLSPGEKIGILKEIHSIIQIFKSGEKISWEQTDYSELAKKLCLKQFILTLNPDANL